MKWINVGIEYPLKDENVLLSDGKNVGFGYMAIDPKSKSRYWRSNQNLGWITHWMPLPEPPSENKE